MSDERKGHGFTPQWSPGRYGGGGTSQRSSSDNAPNREAGSGTNKGGETGKPITWTIDKNKDD